MKFAERFGISPRDLRAQPARDVIQWLHYTTIENEAAAISRRIGDARSAARARGSI